jgi:ABC-2 type transport system permease protein
MTSPNRAATSPAGSIYDLGYRHYEGKRNGRAYAMWSLFVESIRGVWGFGRPMSAKAAPFILAGIYSLLAVIQLAFSSFFSQAIQQGQQVDLFTYANYFQRLGFLVIFFCVAQAPEVVCRDQRYQVLPLYLTKAMGRVEYAIARLASLVVSLFIVLIVPMIALFVGDVLMKTNTFGAIGDEWPQALPALPAYLLVAISMGSISLAVSSFSPRRAYAAIGLLAYFLLMETIPAVIYGVGLGANWGWSDNLILLTPITSLGGAVSWFFGVRLTSDFPVTISAGAYVWAGLASVVVFAAILLVRYRRLPA